MAPYRWWDGWSWTGYLSAGVAPRTAAASPVSPAELTRAHSKELQMWRWARLALGVMFISAAAQCVATFAFAHAFHQFWKDTQLGIDGQTVTPFPARSFRYLPLFDALYLLSVAAAIPFFVWQHSAATVARGLGYPARVSPGLGVGSWFIPIVNLWFPVWALSDTLPPDHPLRPRCLWAWLAWIGAGVANGVAFFVAIASTAAAVIPIAIAAVLIAVAIGLGAQLVAAVNLDHQQRMGTQPRYT